jgi:hypothetical protein
MEGPSCGFRDLLRLTRGAESSRLQLDLVRRAFELLVPNSQHPVSKRLAKRLDKSQGARRRRSAVAARRVAVAGG